MANINAPADCVGGYSPKQFGGIPMEACREGYSPRSSGNRIWCCPNTYNIQGQDAAAGAKTTEPTTFAWSPSQQSTMTQLIERAGALLKNPTGMTPGQRENLYGYVTRGIKAPLAGELRGVEEAYGRAGLTGSPAQISEQEKVRRNIRQQVAEARAKLAIDEQQQGYERQIGGATAAGGLLTQTASMEKAIEEANAARRGEGRDSINQLLALFQMLFGANASSYNSVLQAIMGRLGGTQQSQGGFGDWLPYLGMLAGQKLEKP